MTRTLFLGFYRRSIRTFIAPTVFLLTAFVLTTCSALPTPSPETPPPPEPTKAFGQIVVKVFNSRGDGQYINDFIVRVAESNEVGESDNGIIKLFSCGEGEHITAWARGYYINTVNCIPGAIEYNIPLEPITFSNNTNLSWISANISNEPHLNCISCHNGQNSGEAIEYQQWRADGHSSVFQDNYFSTMYMGDDIFTNRVSNTTWMLGDQGHQVRVPQFPSIPFYGTGFKLDYPSENGNCAYCHAPASAIGSQIRPNLAATINEARNGQHSVFTEGITCDICHKVVNVQLDNEGYPFADKPGILSFEFIHDDRNLFMGPLTNAMDQSNMVQNFSCAPVFSESSFCAPCHRGKFFDTYIYNSYGEWKESDYGDQSKESYKTCQSCHMLPDDITNVTQAKLPKERAACSTTNKSNFNFNHNMMLRGTDNLPTLIKQAGELAADGKINEGKIELNVTVMNTNAGHKFPTDSPLRHLILVVDAKSSSGTELPMIKGDRIPPWGGVGTSELDHAGKPGQIYANILISKDTFFSPSVDYWNPAQLAWKKSESPPDTSSDTRIAPKGAANSKYFFSLPPNGKARFQIKLIYRYAFIELSRRKSWSPQDILVTEWECLLNTNGKELECKKIQ